MSNFPRSKGLSQDLDDMESRLYALERRVADLRSRTFAVRSARRVAANTFTYTNQTTNAVVSNATERTALTSSITKRAGTSLLLRVSGTCVLTAGVAQSLYIGLRVGGLDYEVGTFFSEQAVSPVRRSPISGEVLVAGLGAGGLSVEPYFRAGTASAVSFIVGQDFISYSVSEVAS